MSPTESLRHSGLGVIAVAIASSALAHGGLFVALSRPPELRKKNEPITFEVVVNEPPPPPPLPPPPPPEEKKPEPPKPKVALKPPPPNQPPPPDPPKNEPPPPIKIGISLSSTTQGGGFSVGVGNSVYGKPDDKASDPNAVKPYAAQETKKAPYVPITRLTTRPKLLDKGKEPPYPKEAKKAGIEGQVVLLVTIDEHGKVVKAKVVNGPGFGLDEAAVQAAYAWRFAPATFQGEPVVTEDRITYTFVLD